MLGTTQSVVVSGGRCNIFARLLSGGVSWNGRQAGESFRSIGSQLDRTASTIRGHVVDAGWKRPVPAREWSRLRLSSCEHEETAYLAANADGATVCLDVQAKLDSLVASSDKFTDVLWIPGLGMVVQAALGCGEIETGSSTRPAP